MVNFETSFITIDGHRSQRSTVWPMGWQWMGLNICSICCVIRSRLLPRFFLGNKTIQLSRWAQWLTGEKLIRSKGHEREVMQLEGTKICRFKLDKLMNGTTLKELIVRHSRAPVQSVLCVIQNNRFNSPPRFGHLHWFILLFSISFLPLSLALDFLTEPNT